MAERKDIEFTYTQIDRIFRLSLGELADFSGAKYDGDFSLALEEAQRRKHQYVAEQIGIGPGRRVLDLGCGWGALLNFIRSQGGAGVGVTLSRAQVAACRRHGLDVHLKDARTVGRRDFGPLHAVASLGSFEHFCSPEDYRAGRQEEIYRELFARIASLLPNGCRFYLQTMVFGRNMIPVDEVDINAPRDSDSWHLALMERQFPGSFLPTGEEQIVQAAEPHFHLRSIESGRLDYIETIIQWRKRFAEPSLRKMMVKLRLLPRWLTSADFRLAFTPGVSGSASSGNCWTTTGWYLKKRGKFQSGSPGRPLDEAGHSSPRGMAIRPSVEDLAKVYVFERALRAFGPLPAGRASGSRTRLGV
jgi:cyclopropane-fatty-acyl-phospholipid synthase